MRNTLTLLSSLALAASSNAVQYATATSSMDLTFDLGSGQTYQFLSESETMPGRMAGQYVYNQGPDGADQNPVYEYLNDYDFSVVAPVADPSRYTASLSGDSNGFLSGNRMLLSATSSITFSGKDADQFVFRRYGYRFFLKVTGGNTDEDVTFKFGPQFSSFAGTADIPYDYPHNIGQYAEAGTAGDVRNILDDQPGDYTRFGDTPDSTTGTAFSKSEILSHITRTFQVKAGKTAEFEIFCSAYGYVEDDHRAAPVPEPASLAALALGALGLLRRRKA